MPSHAPHGCIWLLNASPPRTCCHQWTAIPCGAALTAVYVVALLGRTGERLLLGLWLAVILP